MEIEEIRNMGEVEKIVKETLDSLRVKFDPEKTRVLSDNIRLHVALALLGKFGNDPEVQKATSIFVNNLVPDHPRFCTIENFDTIYPRIKQYSLGYLEEIKCLI